VSTLERALTIAATAHAGQKERNGSPYILHPIRVMLAVSTPVEQMAAVLHDVVEDTPITPVELRDEGFPAEVLKAVELLTHDGGTPYLDYVRRAGTHAVARAVKVADLRDNLDASRLPIITDRDRERFRRYEAALALLSSGGAS
jgi:(p)ppGpp synthase/HD superfamily hydrolase